MKRNLYLIFTTVLVTACFVRGQGNWVYDQQSTNLIEGAALLNNLGQPMGQSFTPSLASVGFVTLNLYNNFSGSVYVNLRSNSITGPILSSTTPVFMPDSFFGITNFLFAAPVAVIPGVIYYLQPEIQSGSAGFASYVTDASYVGGSAIYQGVPVLDRNLWFREGIVVPEPSSIFLLLTGGTFALLTSFRRRARSQTASGGCASTTRGTRARRAQGCPIRPR